MKRSTSFFVSVWVLFQWASSQTPIWEQRIDSAYEYAYFQPSEDSTYYLVSKSKPVFISLDKEEPHNILIKKFGNDGRQLWRNNFTLNEYQLLKGFYCSYSDAYLVTITQYQPDTVKFRAPELIVIFRIGDAGELVWRKEIEISDHESLNQFFVTATGQMYLFYKRWEANTARRKTSLYLQKRDSEGQFLWEKEVYSQPGYLSGLNLVRHPNGSFSLLSYDYGGDDYLFHLDSLGNEKWRVLVERNSHHYSSIQLTKEGQILLRGSGEGVSSNSEAYLSKWDLDGNPLWVRSFSKPEYFAPEKIFETHDGGLLIGGTTTERREEFAFMDHPPDKFASSEIGVMKMDSTGNILWKKYYGGTQLEDFEDMVLREDGRIFISALTNSYDGHVGENRGIRDVWLLELDAQGNYVHSEVLGGEWHEIMGVFEKIGNTWNILGRTRKGNPMSTGEIANPTVWLAPIEGEYSSDSSKGQTQEPLSALNIRRVEQIGNAKEVDHFLRNRDGRVYESLPRSEVIELTHGDYLQNYAQSQWYTRDFNHDNQLDLLVYGIPRRTSNRALKYFDFSYDLYALISQADGSYKSTRLIDKLDIFKTRIHDSQKGPMVIVEYDMEKVAGHYSFKNEENRRKFILEKKPFPNDTLVFWQDRFINYTSNPLAFEEIEWIEFTYNPHGGHDVRYWVYPGGKIERNILGYLDGSWGRVILFDKKWKLNRKKYHSLLNLISVFDFPQMESVYFSSSSILLHSASSYLRVVLSEGDTLEHYVSSVGEIQSSTFRGIQSFFFEDLDKIPRKQTGFYYRKERLREKLFKLFNKGEY